MCGRALRARLTPHGVCCPQGWRGLSCSALAAGTASATLPLQSAPPPPILLQPTCFYVCPIALQHVVNNCCDTPGRSRPALAPAGTERLIVDPPCGAATDLVGVRMKSAREWAFRGGTRGECTAACMPPCPIAGGRVGFIARTAASGQEPISAHMSSVCKLFFVLFFIYTRDRDRCDRDRDSRMQDSETSALVLVDSTSRFVVE